jgi:hypothetical protein
MSNVYYDPHKCGLEIIGKLDEDLSYEFNMLVVWRNAAGELYYSADSG